MIVIPTRLFHYNADERLLTRRENGELLTLNTSRNDNEQAEELCYCLPGDVLIDVLILWRESHIGETHFIKLTDNELGCLDQALQNIPTGTRKVLKDAEIEKLSHTIGIASETGAFTRNPLIWQNMTSLDGTFAILRSSILFVQRGPDNSGTLPSQFLLTDEELAEVLRLNNRKTVSKNEEVEGVFLQSALALLKDKHAREAQETDVYRRLYYRHFPAPNELMMHGSLRKRNKNLGWKERFVALAPGKMFYVEKLTSSTASNVPPIPSMTSVGGPASAAGSAPSNTNAASTGIPKVIPLVAGRTWCRPASEPVSAGTPSSIFTQAKYDSDRVIELLVSEEDSSAVTSNSSQVDAVFPSGRPSNGNSASRSSSDVNVTKYYWACDSKEERDRWVHLIQAASTLGAASNAHPTSSAEHIRTRVAKCVSTEELLTILREMESKDDLRVSVDFIQTNLNRARGEMDASVEQTAKDTARDAVLLNGRAIVPCTFSAVMSALTNVMSEVIHCDEPIANLLDFARLVLLATNRTQSGGLAYEATNLVVTMPIGGTVLVPVSSDPSRRTSPIIITVERPSPPATLTPVTPARSGPEPEAVSTSLMVSTPTENVAKAAPSSGQKRRFHTRTVSDPQFFLKFLSGSGMVSHSMSSSTLTEKSSSAGSMTSSAGMGTPKDGPASTLPTAPMLASAAANLSNPTSPRNSLMRSLSMRRKTVESEGLSASTTWYEEHIKLKVHVKADMEFNLLDEMDINHRLATVKAVYTRAFCLVEGRCFAVDQGNVILHVSNVAASATCSRVGEDDETNIEHHDDDAENDGKSDTGTLIRHSTDEGNEKDEEEANVKHEHNEQKEMVNERKDGQEIATGVRLSMEEEDEFDDDELLDMYYEDL